MNVPVVWVNYNPDRPAGPTPYWDNAIVDWLLTDAWAPGMPTFTYHWSFEDVHPSSGVVVVTPGHYGREGIRRLNEAIGAHPWALVIITVVCAEPIGKLGDALFAEKRSKGRRVRRK